MEPLHDDVVVKLLKARDALLIENINEAYHQIYAIAHPKFDTYYPFQEWEKQVNFPNKGIAGIEAAKEYHEAHYAHIKNAWVKVTDRLPGWGRAVMWGHGPNNPYRFGHQTIKYVCNNFLVKEWEGLYWYDEAGETKALGEKEVENGYHNVLQQLWPLAYFQRGRRPSKKRT